VIHGEADGLIPAVYADAFAKAIPDARVEHIPGAGHLPMIEAEDAFLKAVEGFLD
jgi:pimeloyl-ACP methyl ester carboxylesterase